MKSNSSPRVISSLDEAIGPGAESLVRDARRRKLLNGLAIGVMRDGQSFLRFYGERVGIDSIFELGSLTRTYTAELLAKLVERGVVRLEDPVALYLPGGLTNHSAIRPITLLDLATHQSGEPRLPPGINGLSRDPYARYSSRDLEKYLRQNALQLPIEKKFRYSNLGYSVLGYALGKAAATSYAKLLQREIFEQLQMRQTVLALGQAQPALLKGYTQIGIPTKHWNFDAFAPCGAVCSTASDQLKYLAWLLEDVDRLSLQPKASAPGGEVGLGWMIRNGGNSCWHNGATFGFSSYLSLDRRRHSGVVVLSQMHAPALVVALGREFERCLAGEAIRSLDGEYGRTRAWVFDPLLVILSPLSPIAEALASFHRSSFCL